MMLILLSITLIFPFVYKYSFVITNQYSQIPIILKFIDPRYLQNDWYVTVNQSFGPRTIFAWYMAQTAKIISLPATFLLHYLLYIFLITYSSYKLTFIIFKNKFIALVTTICILFGTSITLGGNILVTADLSAPQLPLGLTLLGTVFLIEKKYLKASLIYAISSLFHPLIGFEGTALFICSLSLAFISLKKPICNLIKKTLIPYLLVAVPVFLLYTKETLNKTVSAIDKINILAYMRNPHHFIASSWPLSEFVQFFLFLTLFVVFLMVLQTYLKPFLFRFFAFSIFLIIIACLFGYLGIEVFSFYPLTILQTFRLTVYLYWLGAIIIIGGSLFMAFKSKSVFSLLFLIPILLSDTQILHPSGKIETFAVFLGIFLLLFFRKLPKTVFIFLLLFFFSLSRFHQRFNFSSYIYQPTNETELALWVKNNTPPDSIFLVPPEFETFRLIAQRAIVVDWKSFPFQEKAMRQWAKRICDLGNLKNCNYKKATEEQVINGYRSLSPEIIVNLKNRYGFQYIITDIYYPHFKLIHNNHFYIYEILNEKI